MREKSCLSVNHTFEASRLNASISCILIGFHIHLYEPTGMYKGFLFISKNAYPPFFDLAT